MENKKTFGILSLIFGILALAVPMVLAFDTLNAEIIFLVVCLLVAIAAIVFGVLGKKTVKGLSIAGLVIGIIAIIFIALELLGIASFGQLTNCVDAGDGTATCELMDQTIDDVPIQYIDDTQMKEGE